MVIALGDGSTMDAAKVIAAATLYDGDPWNLIGHGQENWVIPTQALPIITVPTLAATGSEMNCGAVISNAETKVKSIGCPTRLSEVGIGEELFSQYAADAVLVVRDEAGNLPGRPALSKADIVTVLKFAL